MADVLARRLRPEDADSPADGLDDGKHWVWSFPPPARRSIRRIPGRRVSRRSWRKQPVLYRPQKRVRLNKLFRREGREIRLPVQVFPEPLIHCRSPGRPSVCAPCQPSSRALNVRGVIKRSAKLPDRAIPVARVAAVPMRAITATHPPCLSGLVTGGARGVRGAGRVPAVAPLTPPARASRAVLTVQRVPVDLPSFFLNSLPRFSL